MVPAKSFTSRGGLGFGGISIASEICQDANESKSKNNVIPDSLFISYNNIVSNFIGICSCDFEKIAKFLITDEAKEIF
jgi:hypothetical protein